MMQVDDARVCLQQAQAYWQEQDWQLTIESCAEALAINQRLPEAHKLMGDVLQRMGKSKEAIGYYVQAIACKPDYAEVYANLGALYAKQEQWERAEVHYQKAIAYKPDFVGVYRLLARVYQMQGHPEKAADCMASMARIQTIESEPVEQPAGNNTQSDAKSNTQSLQECLQQAQRLRKQGEFAAALEHYRQAIDLEPNRRETYKQTIALCEQSQMWSEAAQYCRLLLQLNNSPTAKTSLPSHSHPAATPHSYIAKAEYHYNLGSLYSGKQQHQQAIEQYQQAIAIDPQMTKAYRSLARIWSQLGDKQRSSEALLRAVALENEAVTAAEYVELAQNLGSWGKLDSAITCYRRATERQPDLAEAYLGWGALLVQNQLGEDAIACYVAGVKHTQDGELYYRLGRLYRIKQEWSKAIVCYQKAVAALPEHGAAHHELGEVLSQEEQWSEAIASYRQAVKHQPDFSWSYNNLGYALIQLGQWSEAIPVYQEAIKLNPEFPWAYYNLGEAHTHLKQWSEAVAIFKQAAKLQPDLPHLQQQLGNALYQRSQADRELALQHLNLAVRQEPNDLEAYYQALAIDKMNLELYLQLAQTLESQGEVEKAIATYQTALQIQPKNSEAIARLQALALDSAASGNTSELALDNNGNNESDLPAPAPQIIEFSPEDLKF